jgi:hypothetical protein
MRPLPLNPITVPPIVNGPAAAPEPEPEPEPDPDPEPEPEPEPDPEPEPEPEPVPVPDGCFRPLQAESTKDMIIRDRSDFWLGFMVCLISSFSAHGGCKVLQQTYLALQREFVRAQRDVNEIEPPKSCGIAHTPNGLEATY